MKSKIILTLSLLTLAAIGVHHAVHQQPPAKPVAAAPAYGNYDYGRADAAKIIDFGTQPNAIFTSESLFHDRILRQQLAAEGWQLREHRYRNGKDMVPYSDGRLDVMVLGDIPAFLAMQQHRVGIFALCRQGYNTIIAKRRLTPPELKGLRIGYPPNTTAHFTLDRTLRSAGLSMKEIVTVPMAPDEMAAALASGTVDAVVSWEPTASKILALPGSRAISVSEGFSYIAFDLDFAARHPRLQKAILAAVLRAATWAKLDERNIHANLTWDRQAAVSFFGSSPVDANPQWVSLLRKETIDNPSFPMLPLNFSAEQGIQHQQFEFLKEIGALSSSADWKKISSAVNTSLLPEITTQSKTWLIDRFDYASDKLPQGK